MEKTTIEIIIKKLDIIVVTETKKIEKIIE